MQNERDVGMRGWPDGAGVRVCFRLHYSNWSGNTRLVPAHVPHISDKRSRPSASVFLLANKNIAGRPIFHRVFPYTLTPSPFAIFGIPHGPPANYLPSYLPHLTFLYLPPLYYPLSSSSSFSSSFSFFSPSIISFRGRRLIAEAPLVTRGRFGNLEINLKVGVWYVCLDTSVKWKKQRWKNGRGHRGFVTFAHWPRFPQFYPCPPNFRSKLPSYGEFRRHSRLIFSNLLRENTSLFTLYIYIYVILLQLYEDNFFKLFTTWTYIRCASNVFFLLKIRLRRVIDFFTRTSRRDTIILCKKATCTWLSYQTDHFSFTYYTHVLLKTIIRDKNFYY